MPVVRRDCRGFRLCLCVILIFICESSVHCEDRMQGIQAMFVCDCDMYCESSVSGKDREQGL
jgi:hypothetical protein